MTETEFYKTWENNFVCCLEQGTILINENDIEHLIRSLKNDYPLLFSKVNGEKEKCTKRGAKFCAECLEKYSSSNFNYEKKPECMKMIE